MPRRTPSGRMPTARGRSRRPRWSSRLVDVAGRSDWQSPLYVALAPLALSARLAAGGAGALGLRRLPVPDLVAAHPPARPLLAADAAPAGDPGGSGGRLDAGRGWSILLGSILAAGDRRELLVRLDGPDRASTSGPATWRPPDEVPAMLNPPLARLDAELPPEAKVLLVGQAAVFHLDHPIVYNTVFNHETFETLARAGRPSSSGGRSPAGHHSRLCRLVRDRPLPLAGQLRLHRLRDARAVRRLVGRRARAPRPVGPRQELYRGPTRNTPGGPRGGPSRKTSTGMRHGRTDDRDGGCRVHRQPPGRAPGGSGSGSA